MLARHLKATIQESLTDTPVVYVAGARQVGKTTLARQLVRSYLTLDDATSLGAARQDPSGFLAGLHTPVVIDEVQHVPELFPALKLEVEADRSPGRFLLTGSSNVLL
ncbi:AAA family ATPase, partial [bacterium CPR1]|nr:AAA family ATPase [bacterium CPR1]